MISLRTVYLYIVEKAKNGKFSVRGSTAATAIAKGLGAINRVREVERALKELGTGEFIRMNRQQVVILSDNPNDIAIELPDTEITFDYHRQAPEDGPSGPRPPHERALTPPTPTDGAMQAELTRLRTENERLSNQNALLAENNEGLQRRAADAEELRDLYQIEVERLTAEFRAQQEAHRGELLALTIEHELALKYAAEQLHAAEQLLEEQTHRIEQLEREIKRFERQLETIHTAHETLIRSKAEEIAKITAKINQLRHDLSKTRHELEAKTMSYETMARKKEEISTILATFQTSPAFKKIQEFKDIMPNALLLPIIDRLSCNHDFAIFLDKRHNPGTRRGCNRVTVVEEPPILPLPPPVKLR